MEKQYMLGRKNMQWTITGEGVALSFERICDVIADFQHYLILARIASANAILVVPAWAIGSMMCEGRVDLPASPEPPTPPPPRCKGGK